MANFPVARSWEELLEKVGSTHVFYVGHRRYNGNEYPSYSDMAGNNVVIYIADN